MQEIKRRDFLALGLSMVTGLAAEGLTIDPSGFQAPGSAESNSPVKFSLADNKLSFQSGWCTIPDWGLAIEADNQLLRSTDAKFEIIADDPRHLRLLFPGHPLTWDLRSEIDRTGRLLLSSTIRNDSRGRAPVRLGKAFLIQTEKIDGFCKPGDKAVYLAMTSGQKLNQVKDLDSNAAQSDIAIQAFNQSQTKALQIGFATFLRAKTQIEHRCSQDTGLQVKAWCDFDGWELSPGSETPTETLTVAIGNNPLSQLEGWGDTAARVCRIRPREWDVQPHGWLGWSWVDPLYVERYEDVVLRNAKSIRERLAGFGIEYIWESIGNLKDGQPGDWLNWNSRYFPNGHQYLHDQLEHLGIKWGLWCGAFMLSSKLEDKVKNLWDALFKQPDGKPMVYLPAWGYGLDSPTEDYKKPLYALDPVIQRR